MNAYGISQADEQEHHVAICVDRARGSLPQLRMTRGMVVELCPAQAHALVNTPCYQAAMTPTHWGVALPEYHSTARKTLDQLGFVDYTPLVALRVAEPLAMLMARGAWKTLSLACSDTLKDRACRVKVPACASSLFQSVPEQVRKQKLAYGRAAEASDAVAQFDLCHFPSELHLAADKLIEWAPAILSKHVQDSGTLTFLVDRLRTAASSLERPVGRNPEHGGGRRRAQRRFMRTGRVSSACIPGQHGAGDEL